MIPRKLLGRASRELPVLGMEVIGGQDFGVELSLGGPRWPYRRADARGVLEPLPEEPVEACIAAYPGQDAVPELLAQLRREKDEGRFTLCGLKAATVAQGFLAVYLDLFDFLVLPYNPFHAQADLDLLWVARSRDCGVLVVEPTGLELPSFRTTRERRWPELEAGLSDYQGHVPWLALQFALHHPGVTAVCPQVDSPFEFKEWLQGLMLPPLSRDQFLGVKRAARRG